MLIHQRNTADGLSIGTVGLSPRPLSGVRLQCLVYLICVSSECFDLVKLRAYALDVFSRHLVDPLGEVVACPVQAFDQ